MTRNDRNIVAGGTCDTSFTAPVIYQSMWVNITSDAQNFIELGTMHKSSTCKYWYWGYGTPNGGGGVDWHVLGIHGPIGSARHTFAIQRGATGNTWRFSIDVTTLDERSMFFQNLGAAGSAGLESYSPGATVASHTFASMQVNVGGPWYNFSGTDASVVHPEMCGSWLGSVSWRAGQNVPC